MFFSFQTWVTLAGCHLKYLSITFQWLLYCFTKDTDRTDVFTAFPIVNESPSEQMLLFWQELYIIRENVTASKWLAS